MDDLSQQLQTILGGQSRSNAEIVDASNRVREILNWQFGTRASAAYEVDYSLERSSLEYDHDSEGVTLQFFDFVPENRTGDVRLPKLRVLLVSPIGGSGLFLLLTDGRRPDDGPADEEKDRQRKRVRGLLTRHTSLASQFEPSVPRPLLGEVTDTHFPYVESTLFYRYYDGGRLPASEEIIGALDGLLRLREVYIDRFYRTDLIDDGANLPNLQQGAEVDADGGESLGEPSLSGGEDIAPPVPGEVPDAVNLLLYGPPGTGKTHSTKRRALELCGVISEGESVSRDELERQYRRLRSNGRIDFVTFHQSYGYEEFVEGIRPVLSQDVSEAERGANDVEYERTLGRFTEIALSAASEGLFLQKDDRRFEARWRALQRRVESESDFRARSLQAEYRVETESNTAFRLVRVDGSRPRNPSVKTAEKRQVKRWWNQRSALGTDFDRLTTHRVQDVLDRPGNFTRNWVMYRLLMEEVDEDDLDISGVGLEASNRTHEDVLSYLDERSEEHAVDPFSGFGNAPSYVLIIDEINRGNISKILGELITLLEPSKRLGCDDELLVRLPYSGDAFGVPPNLHILGTMNTADRSIALLDAALRRRLTYEEMMPDASVWVEYALDDTFEAESLEELSEERRYLVELMPALLETINERVEFLYDRDHQIGHTYLMGVSDLEELRQVFNEEIVPLLEEYFYGNRDQIGLVLGSPYDRRGEPARTSEDEHAFDSGGAYRAPILQHCAMEEESVLRMDHRDYQDRSSWEVHPAFADRRALEAQSETPREQLKVFFEGILPSERREAVLAGRYVRDHLECDV